MHSRRSVLACLVIVGLVAALAPAAVAQGASGGLRGQCVRRDKPKPTYRVSKPRVASSVVIAGATFDASGSVVPSIAVDASTTTVAILVLKANGCRRASVAATVPATLTGPVGGGTGYAASLSLPNEGLWSLVAVVLRDGAIVARSEPREMKARLPYRVSKPRVLHPVVIAGATFDASGSVTPTIPGDASSTAVAIRVLKVDKHGRSSVVATVPATLTGPAGGGTGYAASLSLPGEGRWALVAVVLSDGAVAGRSTPREMRARLPYRVSTPRVASCSVVASATFEASGSVSPTIAADASSTTVAVLVLKVDCRGRTSVVATVPATLTGPAGGGTGYMASLSLPSEGRWALVAVVLTDGAVAGRSAPREMKARAVAPTSSRRDNRRR